jgi:WD40 repeat protein
LPRRDLFTILRRFTPADFDTLLAAFPGADAQVSRYITVPEQAAQLLRWAESPTGPGLPAVEREVLQMVGPGVPTGRSAPFVVPFPQNPDFVGRTEDLQALHNFLQERKPVAIRPAGLTGMGGIGKTQLAVEYVYRYKADYPGGIFWVNVAEPLAKGLARVGVELRPEAAGQSPEQQLKTALKELKQRSNALLVFDNLEDPAQLSRPIGTEMSPDTLGCAVLFTTRRRELGRFYTVELSVLPEEPALQLLLRGNSRQALLDDPNHSERPQARVICRLLGYLPLALELASAFLAEWPDVPLTDYRKRLEDEGCLATLDSEVPNLSEVNFQPIHEAAVAATLRTHWEALRSEADETARLVFRTAGQFGEAASIPTAELGLFAGVPDVAGPADPSPLRRALKRLHSVRLVEELLERDVRLHPLVREFAAALTTPAETPAFRHDCACRVARAFEDFATLEETARAEGVEGLQQTLKTALDFLAEGGDELAEVLHAMLRVVPREAHRLREWEPGRQPNDLAQQVLFRAGTLGETALTARAELWLRQLDRPALVFRWRTLRESPALLRILVGHRGPVRSVAVSPDGRLVVTGSHDGTALVWDLATGQRLRLLDQHGGTVYSVAVGPAGRLAVTGSHDGTASVWDLATGQRLRLLDQHTHPVISVAVSSDGQLAVTVSFNNTVAIWDLATGRRLRELVGHRGTVIAVAVSPDGRFVVTGSVDQNENVAVWDLRSGERLRKLDGHGAAVTSVAFNPDGRFVVTGSDDRTASVWDLRTGERFRTLAGHGGKVTSVAVSPDGRYVLSGCDDGSASVWDLRSEERFRTLAGHGGAVTSVAVSPDGRHAVTGLNNSNAVVWDYATEQPVDEPAGHRGAVTSLAVGPDGRHIISGSRDGTAVVWDPATGRRLRTLAVHGGAVTSVAVSPDGRLVVTGCDDGTASVWDLRSGERFRKLDLHRESVTSVAVGPDGRHAITGSHDLTVAVWELATGRRLRTLAGHGGAVTSVAVGPDGRHIVSGSVDRTAVVWDLATGLRLELAPHGGAVTSVAVGPDGRHIVSGSRDGTAVVWDLATGLRLRELARHGRAVTCVAVGPYGLLAVSGSGDQSVAVWDLTTGQVLTQLSLDSPALCVAWSPEGRFLIAGSDDGNLYGIEYRERGARHVVIAGSDGGNLYGIENRERGPRHVVGFWGRVFLRIKRVMG